MADFPAFAVENDRLRPTPFAPLPGRAAGLKGFPAQPPDKPDFRNAQALAVGGVPPGIRTAGPGQVFPAAPMNNFPAIFTEDTSIGGNWFEKTHILPRTFPQPTWQPIDFGNIISPVEETFELFSAFRRQTVTLSTFTNNVGAGMEIPDLPALPYLQEPFTSILDPASTPLNPLPLIVRATPDGPATFNDSLDFLYTLGAGTRQLFVTGDRIALVLVQPSGNNTGGQAGGFDEILQFLTNIQPATNGKEKRDSPRKQPRQILDWEFSATELDRQILQALIFEWQSRTFAVPIWFEQVKLTTAITGGTTSTATTEDLTFVDMRVGQLAVVVAIPVDGSPVKTFDVLTVDSKTASSVTFESTIQNSYDPADTNFITLVVPVFLCHAQQSIGARRFPVEVEQFNVRFRVIDNDTGAPTPSLAAFNSYDGKTFFDDCNLIRGTQTEGYERRIFVFDNGVGLVGQDSPWDHGKRTATKGFYVSTRRQLYELRQALLALRGRQISWWTPTFHEDLTVSQDLVISQNTMDITNIGYARFIQSREYKKRFRITFTDGTSLIRVVQSATELSPDEERLTLDTIWPAARTVSEIVRVEFLELTRFDTDSLRIRHQTIIGRASLIAPTRTVNDLD